MEVQVKSVLTFTSDLSPWVKIIWTIHCKTSCTDYHPTKFEDDGPKGFTFSLNVIDYFNPVKNESSIFMDSDQTIDPKLFLSCIYGPNQQMPVTEH